ncbi:Transposase [Edwardsiella anguillarum ET080813]|uniref:Transposase n=1 Tax=Edwardsiella anguillarum ET080813 TaxID=667120 RepID=A0A076LHU7_9GAMM|nr:Transposase [Edwardsiella anguillarum ET080813]
MGFVDKLDMPYSVAPEQLNVMLDSLTKDISISGLKPYDFFIVPVSGTVTLGSAVTRGTTINAVKAYLGSTSISGGFVGNKQLALSTAPTVIAEQAAIPLNGKVLAITTDLMIKRVFNLSLRALQDFVDSIFRLMDLPLHCPGDSLVSKRAKHINISIKTPTRGEISHLVVDCSGLKVFGDGEWKV